jgi:hypothetical protein
VIPDRFVSGAAAERAVMPARFRDESEAELAVTRICDSILGRLDEAKARDDRDSRKRRLRRPDE